ncbi:CHASE2 domain-containing protein [Brevundimonas sp. TWP2-3-4b2]|uniref:CHASE2 domain-containing protein n=1 Tax=Brevundimonas sp. TWP2-3-4b2 TaxID=2804595 RepID=UPI003CF02527
MGAEPETERLKEIGSRLARSSLSLTRYIATAGPGLTVALFLLILHYFPPPFVGSISNLVFDTYQRAYPRPYEDAGVRVVDIDDESIRRLGQWPWPRTDVVRLTDALTDAGAAAIAFDIVFSEPDRTSPARAVELLRQNPEARGDYAEIAAMTDHDELLGQAMGRGPTVTGYFLTEEANTARPAEHAGVAVSGTPPLGVLREYNGAIVSMPVIGNRASGAGSVSLDAGRDDIIRAVPLIANLDGQIVPSLSLEALRVAQGAGAVLVRSSDGSGEFGGGPVTTVLAVKTGDLQVPTTDVGELWMHYTAPHPERIVPAWRILQGDLPEAEMRRLFEGQIVFIGTGAIGLRDIRSTPTQAGELGVVIHAQAAEQMIVGKFLSRPDWAPGAERMLMVVLCLLIALSAPALGALRGGVLAILALGGVLGGSWFAFRNSGLLLEPIFPALGVVSVYIAITAVSFYREERARSHIHNAFDRYLSPELVDRIARDPGQLELGGEVRQMTVLFSDVRGFSRISERFGPQELIRFLINLLTPMTDVLLARKATIDKYIGDAVLAFWNAPLDDPEHERNAAYAALEMLETLKRLNTDSAGDPAWPGQVAIGIGLNTGPCCVGNMGSRQRLSYSLIGDTVNLASRLESLTKAYSVNILIGEDLAARLSDFALLELDLIRVVGRDAPERIFALMGPPEMSPDPAFVETGARMAAILEAYRSRDWGGTEAALETLRATGTLPGLEGVAAVYATRVADFRLNPPSDDWDGISQALEK